MITSVRKKSFLQLRTTDFGLRTPPSVLTPLLSRRRREQRRSLSVRIGRQLSVPARRKAGVLQPSRHLLLVESLPDVTELNGVVRAIVDDEVHEEKLSARFEHSLHFAHQHFGIGDEVRDEKEDRRVQRAVLDRQILDRSRSELDVGLLA